MLRNQRSPSDTDVDVHPVSSPGSPFHSVEGPRGSDKGKQREQTRCDNRVLLISILYSGALTVGTTVGQANVSVRHVSGGPPIH
ncbi:hypothetical protein F2P81_006084 [Scophthalmus maximus]|uniref:Uncharacterized protein n=1 Tax=Scophthalmus maximus TaxID=52904 RepID=A0A6A4TKJ7_SCOMX|nr:hypothetical protein F2P81_006084 [Scophthalmus maximus]